jgi:hypothetical protein
MKETTSSRRVRGTVIAAASALLLLAAILPSGAEAVQGGIVYGDGWAFMAMAPEGWTWDPITMRNHGIQGLYYKAGTLYAPTALHMYVSPSPKGPAAPRTLASFIAAEEAAFKKLSPGIAIKRLAPLETGPGYAFVRTELDDAASGYYQELAYYDGEACYFVIVLTCRSAEERDRELGAFEELVDSFTCINKE